MRQRLAQEAARVMLESGVPDYAMAKRKAAEKMSAHDTRNLPSNAEIEQAMLEQQRLFNAEGHNEMLARLRETAVDAMTFLQPFRPKLVGEVLSGAADANSRIKLHVFSDTVEQVSIFLMEKHIPYEQDERRYKMSADEYRVYPSFRFFANDVPIELVVFPDGGDRKVPMSPVDGRPMRRAGISEVELLLLDQQVEEGDVF